MKSLKKLSKKTLLALPEERLNNLVKDGMDIIDRYRDKYDMEYLLGDFITIDHSLLLQNRFKAIKEKFWELNYDVLNKDKITYDLRDKIKDKTSILNEIKSIGIKYNLGKYDLNLEFLLLIDELSKDKITKTYREIFRF